MKRVPNMSGKNFITACKWICGGWAFSFCTLLVGQVSTPRMPGGQVAAWSVNSAFRHKMDPPTGVGHAARIRFGQAYGKLPLSFEPNHGQTNNTVQFLSRGEGYTLFLTRSEAVLTLKKSEVRSQKSEEQLTC